MADVVLVHLVKPDGETPDLWQSDGLGRALVSISGTVLVSGIATGGSNTTLQDNTKDWEVNHYEDALLRVVIGGITYERYIISNTADTLTINALPGVTVVSAGDAYEIVETANPLNPLARAQEHNVAVVGGADILGAALAPINTPCLFRIAAGFDAAGVLSVTITRGGNTQVQQFNHGVVLVANCLYMFDHLVHSGDTINYRYSVNATLQTLRVQEIIAATQ
jgi:hypothetical protein